MKKKLRSFFAVVATRPSSGSRQTCVSSAGSACTPRTPFGSSKTSEGDSKPRILQASRQSGSLLEFLDRDLLGSGAENHRLAPRSKRIIGTGLNSADQLGPRVLVAPRDVGGGQDVAGRLGIRMSGAGQDVPEQASCKMTKKTPVARISRTGPGIRLSLGCLMFRPAVRFCESRSNFSPAGST